MKNSTEEKNYLKTILILTLGFSVWSFIIKIPLILYIGIGIGLIGLIFPFLGKLIDKGWMKFAHVLGKVNGGILLSIVFFIFLFPISLLQKLFSKNDSLQLKQPEESNFKERDKTYQKEDLENMW